jgi:hypothetical protein
VRIGFALDGLLCDTQSLAVEWERRVGDKSYLKDESFWAALPAYDDVDSVGAYLAKSDIEVYVLVERPKAFLLQTRTWLRKNFMDVPKERLIMPAIKRYDCRLHDINVFFDSDGEEIRRFDLEKVVRVQAIHVDRASQTLLEVVRRAL